MAKLGNLYVSLIADTAAFSSGLGKARSDLNSTGASFNRGLASIELGFKNLGRTVASVVGGISLAKLVKDIFDAGLRFDQLSTKLTFASGSAAGAARDIDYLRKFTNDLGLSFRATSDAFANFSAAAKGTAIEGDTARAVFEAVAKASAAMKLSADDTSGVFLALGQIVSKGTVQAEELRGQLGERLPGAFQIAARALGVTTSKLGDMLQKGEVVASDFLPKFAAEMEKTFGQAAVDAADSAVSSINRLGNAWDQLLTTLSNNNAIAQGASQLAVLVEAAARGIERFSLDLGFLNEQSLGQVTEQLARRYEQREKLQGRVGSFWHDQPTVKKDLEEVNAEIIRLIELRAKLQAGPPTTPTAAGPAAALTPKTKGKSDAEKEVEAALKRLQQLKQDVNQIGMTGFDLEFAKAVEGLNLANPGVAALVDQFRAAAQAITDDKTATEELDRAWQKAQEAMAAFNAEQAKGKQITESLRTPTEVYRDRVAELNDLHQKGAIDGVTWARGLEQAKRGLDETKSSAFSLNTTVADLGATFASAFEDAVIQGKSVHDVLMGLLQDVERLLLRAASGNLIDFLVGSNGNTRGGSSGGFLGSIGSWLGFGGSGLNSSGYRATGAGPGASANTVASGGGFWSSIGNFFSSIFHEGGTVGRSSVPRRSVPALAFANAPRLHMGGSILKAGEVPIIGKVGETMLTPEQMADMQGGGSGINFTYAPIINAQGAGPGEVAKIRQIAKSAADDAISGFKASIASGGADAKLVGKRR